MPSTGKVPWENTPPVWVVVAQLLSQTLVQPRTKEDGEVKWFSTLRHQHVSLCCSPEQQALCPATGWLALSSLVYTSEE